MAPTDKTKKDEAVETLGKTLKAFGNTVGEIFDDPAVRENAKKFAESVVDAAAKIAQKKVEDNEIRSRVRNVGKAAQTLGKSLEGHFGTSERPEGSSAH